MDTSNLKTQAKEFIHSLSGKLPKKEQKQTLQSTENILPNPVSKRSFSWMKLFLASVSGLVVLGLGMMVVNIIESLFDRHSILGYSGLALFLVALMALLVMSGREVFAVIKLRRITNLRKRGEEALAEKNEILKEEVISKTHNLYVNRPELSHAYDTLSENNFEKLDANEKFENFEKAVISSLDIRARHAITDTAKQVSMLTAVSPIAALDVAFVCWQNVRMLHKLASIYSGRPGTIETIKLTKMVLSHLALTGGIALGDNLLQNLLGRGLAAKVSTRLGEGLANGILTSRVGLAALDLCRPLPFNTEKKPSLKSLIGPLISFKSEENLAA